MSLWDAPRRTLEDIERLEQVPLAKRLAAGSTYALLHRAVASNPQQPAHCLLPLGDPSQPGSLASLIRLAAVYGLVLLPPLFLGIAIVRSRLWDIDLIINRTLVYGGHSGTLLAVYAGCITLLQALVRGLFHQTSDVAIVVSTLVIFILFEPLRKRLQAIIDHRFYRRKYDAARTLEAFSATLRHEVDLSQLSEDLVAVVQETMQPAHVSLWLRPTVQKGKEQATWSSPPPAP